MAEELNRFRLSHDLYAGQMGDGRRSLPLDNLARTPERQTQGWQSSTPNMAWKNRASLNVERNISNNYNNSKDVTFKGKYFADPTISKMAFGSPSFPSPLDRIRSGHQERKLQFGLSPSNDASFEGNQSFPKACKTKLNVPSRKLHLDNFKGGDLNEVSFSGAFSQFNKSEERHAELSFLDRSQHLDTSSREVSLNNSSREVSLNQSSRDITHNSTKDITYGSSKESSLNVASAGEKSMSESWTFYNYIGNNDVGSASPSNVRNPNKALCTINGKTSEILIANEMACELFSYEEDELIGRLLKDMVKLKPKDQATILESHLESSGDVVNLAGKVVDAIDKNGLVLPVSMWVKKLDCDTVPRCLVVLEPVERSVARLQFTAEGKIVSCDDQLAYIHGYQTSEDLEGTHIKTLIPAFKLPQPGQHLTKDVRKQRATGRTKDGANFPLSVAVELLDNSDQDDDINEKLDSAPELHPASRTDQSVYEGVVWVFANISGLITFLPDGTVHNINDNFALMLFGYKATEIIGKSISMLIPDFYEILDVIDDSVLLPAGLDDDSIALTSGLDDSVSSPPGLEGDSQNDCSSRLSVHSRDSGTHSSRTSSKGASQTDSDDAGIGSSVTSCVAHTRVDLEEYTQGPVTSTPNKPSVMEHLTKRISPCTSTPNDSTNIKQPVPADIKLDLLTPEDTGVSPEKSSSNHSTISTSSTETLLTAREHTLSTSNMSKSPRVMEHGKNLHSDNEAVNLDQSNKENQDPNIENKNEEADVSKPDALVFKIDSETGKYQTAAKVLSSQEDEESVKTKPDDDRNCILNNSKVILNMASGACSSTPVSTPVSKPKTETIEASPCLSDIVSPDSHKKLLLKSDVPINSSSLSDSGDESKLNTTDDLLIASMGMVRLDTSTGDLEASVLSDQVDDEVNKLDVELGQSFNQEYGKSAIDEENITGSNDQDQNRDFKSERKSLQNEIKDSKYAEFSANNWKKDSTEDSKSDMSSQEVIDESLLHRTSINQFLHSRCNKSRNLEDSASYLRQNQSATTPDVVNNPVTKTTPLVNGVETYYPKGLYTPDLSRLNDLDASNSDFDTSFVDGNSPSLQSFEKHEKGVRYITRSKVIRSSQGSRSSDYSSTNGSMAFPEGSYQGQCQHRDRSLLGIVFQLKRVQLDDGNHVYCMWVSRDPEEPAECGRSYTNLTLASSLNSTMDTSGFGLNFSLGQALTEKAHSISKDLIEEDEDPVPDTVADVQTDTQTDTHPGVHTETEEDRAINYGPYSKHYDTLFCIGKGAFGFVRLGQRKLDKTQVVVKFIRRGKVFKDCWVKDDTYGHMPLEVSLLTKLEHPNIVKILDVYENAEFIQMVMEKHGSGMDLFEFIDRSPRMDEPLASYIFKQMVSAVAYLHSRNILHRDIKDENVIVNEQFQIKLIDFGAVAFMETGKLFATFCGTLEYCSPEVLMGNKYNGPELEVWSMGVTLYTLVFGENPFFDVDETIRCVLKPPFSVSSELMMLICWLLHPDPKRRASVPALEKNCWVQQRVDITKYRWADVLPNTEFHGNTASDNRADSPPPINDKFLPQVTSDLSYHGDNNDDVDQLKCNLLHQLNLSASDDSSSIGDR